MHRKNLLLTVAFSVLFAAFLFTIHDLLEQRVIAAGDSAPGFSITTEAGKKITHKDFNGKLLMVNFWATWCPPCIEEMPSLNQFAREMSGSGLTVLGISVDRNEKAYKTFLEQNKLSFSVARDPEETISSRYGTFKWPETYVIDRNGKVLQKYIGPRDWTDPAISNSIKAIL